MPDPSPKNGIRGAAISGLPRASSISQVRGVKTRTSSPEQGAASRREFLPSATDVAGIARLVTQQQTNLELALVQLRSLPILGGLYKRDVSFAMGVSVTIAHGLKRKPAYLALNVRGGFARFNGISADSTHIVLQADATVLADIWLFPQPGV
jgi:hypothetical protein